MVLGVEMVISHSDGARVEGKILMYLNSGPIFIWALE